MIVLHKEKLIFLKARKVAGTSFEIALSKYADHSAVITPITSEDETLRKSLGFRGPQNYQYAVKDLLRLPAKQILKSAYRRQRPVKYFNHITARAVKEKIGDGIWDRYTKVSIVRNPFDRMVSRYFWNRQTAQEGAAMSFEEFVLSFPSRIREDQAIYEIDGRNVLDHVIRYENLHEDILSLEERIPSLAGLFDTFKTINAKAQYRPKALSLSQIYSDAPKAFQIISLLCENEMKTYKFTPPEISV